MIGENVPPCPLCGEGGRLEICQLFYCPRCTLWYQGDIDAHFLGQFYPEHYYVRPPVGRLHSALSRLRNRRRAVAVLWRSRDCRAVLDVGCGRGEVLAELQRRGVARVVGMDWNADNARAVAGRLHLQVVGGPGALSELVPESFDAVSMFHVLEHEQRPLELLGHARRLLVPQGRLLIAVPNGASVARRLFGRFWLGYDLPRHRLVFTPRSLRRCLEAAGFELERLSGRFSDQALDVLGSARLWCQGHNIQSRIVPAVIAGVLLPTLTLCRIVGLGSVMYGYARKR